MLSKYDIRRENEHEAQQASPEIAHLLEEFLSPLLLVLDVLLDKRRVRTLVQVCVAIIRFRNHKLGLIHLEQGELEVARTLLEESLTLGKQVGVETDAVHLALGLARLLTMQGDATSARQLYQESLTLLFECNVYKESVAASLEGLAALEAGQGAPRQAVWLWGAAEALREAIGAPMHPVHRTSYKQALALAHTELGEQSFHAAWAEGRCMTPEQALAAQGKTTLPTPLPTRPAAAPPLPSSTFPAGLTAREVEVLRLLAQGWTDAQIAEHLVISSRTVNRHTTSLYSKLGVASRAAATRYAIEHHLL